MAGHNGADPGTGAPTTEAPAPPAKQAPDELLCTICGLTACWTAPGKPPRPAVSAEGGSTTSE